MNVVAEKNDVKVVSETGVDGVTNYTVLFRGQPRCKTTDKQMAVQNYEVLQPQKAVCDKCKQMDVVVFFGKLDIGRLQVAGEGGWRLERIFGGLWDKRDVALCPECALASDAAMNEYLARKKRK
jgi:hypothetical protein